MPSKRAVILLLVVGCTGDESEDGLEFDEALDEATADSREQVWFDDSTPAGATLLGNHETWSWTTAQKVSGLKSHRSVGNHTVNYTQHYFVNAQTTLSVNAGDVLTCYLRIPSGNAPYWIMLQWMDAQGSWEHRAYWGSSHLIGLFEWGQNNTASKRQISTIVPTARDTWIRLEVRAEDVGLVGKTLKGMAFTMNAMSGATIYWDRAGKRAGAAPAGVPATPTLTAPANGAQLPTTQTTVRLAWNAVPGATSYAVRVNDDTNTQLRVPGNNCGVDPHYVCRNGWTSTFMDVPIQAGHHYRWWVHAQNAAGLSAHATRSFSVQSSFHITVANGALPKFMGGLYLGNNHNLTAARNLTYYKTATAQGPAATEAQMGMDTIEVGIAADSYQGETAEGVLPIIAEYKRAGFKYVVARFYLRKDCCNVVDTPADFRYSSEADLMNKVWNHAYSSMRTLLTRSELPILLVTLGTEIDGGHFREWDASADYGGPPADRAKTKRLCERARAAINQAYAESGLQRPYFALHIMPDTDRSYATNLDLQARFLDLSGLQQGQRIFDVVLYSYYPNARGGLNPVQNADRLRALGEASGLPWGVNELGVAQGFAPGPGGWNHFLDTGSCPAFYGVNCSNLLDVQQHMLRRAFEVFESSPRYVGSLYLAPQDNLIGNGGATNVYHFGLWVDEMLSTVVGNSNIVARLTPAFEVVRSSALRLRNQSVPAPAQ